MIPLDKYPHILHVATLRHAIEIIDSFELDVGGRKSLPRALLVFDEQKHLLGYVRRRDILRGLEPKFLRTMPVHHRKILFDVKVDPDLIEFSSDKFTSVIQSQAEQPVSDVMQPIVSTVDYKDHLAKIIYKIIK